MKTTKGSLVSKHIDQLEKFLEGRDIKAFTSYEFSLFSGLDTLQISKFLNVLVSQQVIEKTRKRVLFRDSTNLENVWGLTKDDILDYIIDRLSRERKEIIEDFEKLKEEKVLTSLDVRNPHQLRLYFAEAIEVIGVVRTQNFDIFYYGDYEELKGLIRIKESEALKKVIAKVKQGISFERKVEEFFRNHQHELHFRCIDVKRYVRYSLGDKERVFDLVLFFKLYINNREVPGFPTLVVPVEIKKTATGQAVLLKHLVECLKIFSHNFIPLVVSSNPVRSAFETLSVFKIALLTDSDIKKLEQEGENVKGEGTEDTGIIAAEWFSDD
ncbi:hypothetical protein [Geoglobus ahangari]